MTEIIRYILRFMVGEHLSEDVSRFSGYSSDETDFPDYKKENITSGVFDEDSYLSAKTKPSIPIE